MLRCLLEMKDILDHHEVYYVYSKIWVNHFCVWIQTGAGDDRLRALGESIRTTKVRKEWVGWDLEGLEAATRGVGLQEGSDSDDGDSDDE